MSEPSSDPIRRALRALTHGVYVLSTHHNGTDDFLIVSLAMQTSVEPPRIALALSNNARLITAFRESQRGVLSILASDQIAAVRRYGTPGGVRQAPNSPRTSHSIVIPTEAGFWLELDVHSEQSVGDHALFVATVTGAGVKPVTPDETGTPAPFAPLILGNTRFPYAG